MGLRLPKLFGSSVKRASKVKHMFKGQVVEAIRISYELAGNTKDHADLCATLVALDSVIEAAVDAGGQPETTTDKLNEFMKCLKNDSMLARMEAAKSRDNQNVTQTATQSLRLEHLLEKVKKSPLLRRKHIFIVAEPRIDATVEIPHNAKLPDILWKLRRVCRNGTPSNPHFYPDTAFGEVITEILPLRDRNVNKHDEKWTERIFVYGDNTEGRIRLTSQDETIVRLFGAVERCLVRPPERPLTLFKDIEGHLLAEDEVDQLFLRACNLKCFRWQDSSFVIDPNVKTVQDVISYSKSQENILAASPLSMEPTDLPPLDLRHSTSVLSANHSSGASRVNQSSTVGTSSSLLLAQSQGPMGHRVLHMSGGGPIYAPSQTVSNPPWQEASSGSSSTPIPSHHTVPVDPFPRPSHPPPSIPGPAKDQNPSPSGTLAKAQQVQSAEELNNSIAATVGAGLAGSSGSSNVTTIVTAESRRDGAPTVNHGQRGPHAVDTPQPNRPSRPPLVVPTRSSSQDGSIISLSPTPSAMWSPRADTPLSTITTPSPGPITNPHASNSHSSLSAQAASVHKPLSGPSAEESYGTVTIQTSNPTQPHQSTSSQSEPSPTLSNSSFTRKGPEKPSPPPPPQQAQRENRSWWRRTVDGVTDWWGAPKQ